MNFHKIDEINRNLKITKKAIISLGCSFVEGQGAIDQDIYERYTWSFVDYKGCMVPNINDKEIDKLIEENSILSVKNGEIDWNLMEHKNAFVNVLCNQYFKGKYTPINLGFRGQGNRAAIKNLYFHPDIDWNLIEEMVVIYVPSGPERFDFINDEFVKNFFFTIWPFNKQKKGPKKSLSEGYAHAIYSEKFAILEQISNVIELENWCKINGAKLIITPGFDRSYVKETFYYKLNNVIKRDKERKVEYFSEEISNKLGLYPKKSNYVDKITNMWPWNKMFYPQGAKTFIDLCLLQEKIVNNDYSAFYGVGTPEKWLTVCGHPSAKSHDLFARELHNHLTNQ